MSKSTKHEVVSLMYRHSFKIHVRTEHERLFHYCNKCDYTAREGRQLQKHIVIVHEGNLLTVIYVVREVSPALIQLGSANYDSFLMKLKKHLVAGINYNNKIYTTITWNAFREKDAWEAANLLLLWEGMCFLITFGETCIDTHRREATEVLTVW